MSKQLASSMFNTVLLQFNISLDYPNFVNKLIIELGLTRMRL